MFINAQGSSCYYGWNNNGHFNITTCPNTSAIAKNEDAMLYTGRILTGIGVGISSLVVPVSLMFPDFIGEFSAVITE